MVADHIRIFDFSPSEAWCLCEKTNLSREGPEELAREEGPGCCEAATEHWMEMLAGFFRMKFIAWGSVWRLRLN